MLQFFTELCQLSDLSSHGYKLDTKNSLKKSQESSEEGCTEKSERWQHPSLVHLSGAHIFPHLSLKKKSLPELGFDSTHGNVWGGWVWVWIRWTALLSPHSPLALLMLWHFFGEMGSFWSILEKKSCPISQLKGSCGQGDLQWWQIFEETRGHYRKFGHMCQGQPMKAQCDEQTWPRC